MYIVNFDLYRYVNSVVNSEEWLDETFDSDGEVIGQESSIFAVFEFINVLGESESYQSLLLPILPELLYLLLLYMQITQYQVLASSPGPPGIGLVPRPSGYWPRPQALRVLASSPGPPGIGLVPRPSGYWPRPQALRVLASSPGPPGIGLVPRPSGYWPRPQALRVLASSPGPPGIGLVPRPSGY